jgi:hypothetical protein
VKKTLFFNAAIRPSTNKYFVLKGSALTLSSKIMIDQNPLIRMQELKKKFNQIAVFITNPYANFENSNNKYFAKNC